MGLIAGIGAWLSWKANAAATRASREAEGANRAVNCNKNPNAPRLYELVSENGKKTAVIEERVNGIREHQQGTDRKIENLSTGQAAHAETLRAHAEQLK